MRQYFPTCAALAMSLMGSVLVPAMKADEWNKKTNITIDQPIEIQDTVLPPGSYVIKLADLSSERRLVQVFDAAEDHLITTVFTVAKYRLVPAGGSEFKFYESENGHPPALHTWFYPGETTGLEFRPGRGGPAAESAQSAKNATASEASSN